MSAKRIAVFLVKPVLSLKHLVIVVVFVSFIIIIIIIIIIFNYESLGLLASSYIFSCGISIHHCGCRSSWLLTFLFQNLGILFYN
jgi:hypothetical protein